MPTLDHDKLAVLTGDILARGGAGPEEARSVARHLVDANLAGHDSHGVAMVPAYVEHLLAGTVQPETAAEVVKDDGAILVFDGCRGFGRRVGGKAMAAAIDRCREAGLVLLGLRDAHHLGRIGAFGEMAAEAGLISIHFVNVYDHRGLVAPFGGRDARFSTNPVCVALPRVDEAPPLLLDMATSRVAFGKVNVAHNKGQRLPGEFLVDPQGRFTDDPAAMFQEPIGALLPFGEHKGFGLAVVCELLAGLLAGGGTIQPENPREGGILNNMLAILIDPARLADGHWLNTEMEAFIDYVKASPPLDPANPVLVPGESERIFRERRLAEGIEIDPGTWQAIMEAAARVGLEAADVGKLTGESSFGRDERH